MNPTLGGNQEMCQQVSLCLCVVLLGAGLLEQEACGWCLHARAVSWCVQGTVPEKPPIAAQRLPVFTHPPPPYPTLLPSLLMHLLWAPFSSLASAQSDHCSALQLFSPTAAGNTQESQVINDISGYYILLNNDILVESL